MSCCHLLSLPWMFPAPMVLLTHFCVSWMPLSFHLKFFIKSLKTSPHFSLVLRSFGPSVCITLVLYLVLYDPMLYHTNLTYKLLNMWNKLFLLEFLQWFSRVSKIIVSLTLVHYWIHFLIFYRNVVVLWQKRGQAYFRTLKTKLELSKGIHH